MKPSSLLHLRSILWYCVLLLCSTTASFAQWQLVDTGAVQNGVVFAKDSPTVAWSVGGAGYIRRSLDGGATWASQPSGTSNNLTSVASVNSSIVWVAGQAGLILKTTDSGSSWVPQPSGVGSQLNGIAAVDATTAWAVGNAGVIRKTVNGGANWNGQTSGTAQPLNSVVAVDANTAWAVGNNGVILKTADGTTWTAQTSGTTVVLAGVTAVDANTAWAVGTTGTILKTVDGGTTWTPQTSGTVNNLSSISAASASVAWAVGDGGTILKTINGGTTWVTTVSGTVRGLLSVAAVDDLTSLSSGFFGTYRLTNDGGATYFGQITGTSQPLHGIVSSSEQNLWTVGFSGAARITTNGGNIWTPQTTPNTRNYYAVAHAGINTLWAVGFNGTIIQTSNGGASWAVQNSGTTTQLQGVAATDSNTAWAVGETGTIINTTNGGTLWSPQTSGTSNHLNAVVAVDASNVWAVGNGGTILKWNGSSWAPQTSGTTTKLNGITAVSATKLWAVGASGLILVTTNGGTTWTPQVSSTTQALNSVSAWDGTNAWAVGDNGVIVQTEDGISWSVETSPTINDWYSVRAVGLDKAFASGNNGSVIRSFTPINPPVVVTRPPTNVSGTTASLNASITPNGSPTTAYIEYGLGASGPYTDTAPLTLTPNDGPVGQTVSANVTGLSPRSTYHYRASASNIAGSTEGLVVVFNTGNTVPVPTLVTASTNEDMAITLTLTANDPDGDALTFEVTEGPLPAAGTLSALTPGNQVTFTPTANYYGSGIFKYRVSDAFGGVSPEQTVTITVNSINDEPVVTADLAHVDGEVNMTFTNTGTWSDPEGDFVTLTASIGSIIKNGDGTWSWSHSVAAPVANVSVTITAKDPSLDEDTVTFTYSVSVPANIAVSIGGNPVADNSLGAPVPLQTTTVGGSAVTVVTVDNSGDGNLSISNIGISGSSTLTITNSVGAPLSLPLLVGPGGSGTFGIRFAPTDDTAQTAQVNITSNAPGALSLYTFSVGAQANRLPVAVNDTLILTTLAATEAADLLDNDSDLDGDTLVISSFTQGASGSVTVALSGNLVYTPGPTYLGYDEFTYTISDSRGGFDTATVVVGGGITPPPVAPGNYAALVRDTGGQVRGLIFFKYNAAGGSSGNLRIGQVVRRFAGPNVGGAGTFNAVAKNNPTMTVNVSVGTNAAGFEALLFSINGGQLTGESTRSPYSKASPAPQAGRFTMLAVDDSVTPPVGACISLRVAADGLVSWNGKNGAGYNFTGSSVLLTAGVTPFYTGRTGVAANVQHSNLIITVPVVYGNLHWSFTGSDARVTSPIDENYPVYGESYVPPANPAAIFGTPSLNVTLEVPSYDTDDLPATVSPVSRVFNVSTIPAPDNLPITRLRFDLLRGLYTGKVNVTGSAPRPFFGAVLRSSGFGRGALMDVKAIGTSRIEPSLPE